MRMFAGRKILVLGAAASLFFAVGGFSLGKPYFAAPAYGKCSGGPVTGIGNPGNNKSVGKAGEHPGGKGGSKSVTGDRGASR